MAKSNRSRSALSWVFMGALFVFCAVLGYLQYRWIGEVAAAARDRLKGSLDASLTRIRQDFSSEITSSCRSILPPSTPQNPAALETEIATRYAQWERAGRNHEIFSRIALAEQQASPGADKAITLRVLNTQKGVFEKAEWPAEWRRAHARLESWWSPDRRQNPPQLPPAVENPPVILPVPYVRMSDARQPDSPVPFPRRDIWLVLGINLQYVREVMIPELVQRDIGPDYQVQVITRATPAALIYHSEADPAKRMAGVADGTTGVFDVQYDQIFRGWTPPEMPPPVAGEPRPNFMRGPRPGGFDRPPGMRTWRGPRPDGGQGQGFGAPRMRREFRRFVPPASGRPPVSRPEAGGTRMRGPGPVAETGRWQVLVRHRTGSLEAVVAQARWRNLAVTGGVFLLLVASIVALVRFTRREQRLAELQMDFVAGVSHELRTPLTVIHTAAYNLRGIIATNPVQVERYGTLIQQESGRLKALVEQVLSFASVNSGRMTQQREPISVQAVIEEALASSKSVFQDAHCVVEKNLDAELPSVLADSTALKQALQNLLSNAAKYGAQNNSNDNSNWIGVSATKTSDEPEMVEIRVADRGPGIPEDEQEHIFDPFFRGRRAIQDQVHGTGLGLNLVKKIVEAHGGSIRVKSAPAKGAEFIVRIPAAPAPGNGNGASK